MTRKYPQADVKILYSNAAGRCAFEDCRVNLILEKAKEEKNRQIGKIAHIIAHSRNGPRADTTYPNEKLDTYENWILLCPTCHDKIDAQEHTYTISDLRKIKSNHEVWVANKLDEGMSAVTFAELEIAAKAIASGQYAQNGDFSVISPEEKIQRNNLTQEVRGYILMGLSRGHEVREYLSKASQLDVNFPARLKEGFQAKYVKLRQELLGNALFIAMFEFAKAGSIDFTQQAASLAILCHLFELCEIFEK